MIGLKYCKACLPIIILKDLWLHRGGDACHRASNPVSWDMTAQVPTQPWWTGLLTSDSMSFVGYVLPRFYILTPPYKASNSVP